MQLKKYHHFTKLVNAKIEGNVTCNVIVIVNLEDGEKWNIICCLIRREVKFKDIFYYKFICIRNIVAIDQELESSHLITSNIYDDSLHTIYKEPVHSVITRVKTSVLHAKFPLRFNRGILYLHIIIYIQRSRP